MEGMEEQLSFVTRSGTKENSLKLKIIIALLEISLVIILLVLWMKSESIRQSKNLWVLFFYNFPSQFLIALVPHEPVFFYFSKFYSPLIVTLVAVVGTTIAELLNYTVFKFVTEFKFFDKIHNNKMTKKFVDFFNKAPFVALITAGITPIPFYPFRFLVVLAHYPLLKYVIAVFVSRTIRFYIFALIGNVLKIPDYFLIILFIFLVIIMNVPIIKNLRRKNKQIETSAS